MYRALPDESFEIINADGGAPIVLLCDHASNAIPHAYDRLGLARRDLDAHIAWDIGAERVAHFMSAALDAPVVAARFSRLLIDLNRPRDHETLIPEVSDKITIPGNAGLDQVAREQRIKRFYAPYHAACQRVTEAAASGHRRPLVIAVHSFTPKMNGFDRPWDVSLMWDKMPGLAHAYARRFADDGLAVGMNQPYGGDQWMHTLKLHAQTRGLAHTQIEIRQDQLTSDAQCLDWGERLVEITRDILVSGDRLDEMMHEEGANGEAGKDGN